MDIEAVLYIILWIFLSCSMILLNKLILSYLDFPYPMLLTTYHMIIATVITRLLSVTTKMLTAVNKNQLDYKSFFHKIIPIALCFSISLVFSNEAYLFLSVAYIQMLKAFMPVVVLCLSVIFGLEISSVSEFFIIFVICIGISLTTIGELHFSVIGFSYQLIGILSEASRLVLINILMKDNKLDSLSLLYYVAPCCALFISIPAFYYEGESFLNHYSYSRIHLLTMEFKVIVICNGIFAFLLNIAVVLLISKCSALILTLSGIIKDILLLLVSIIIFQTQVSPLQYFGYFIALAGITIHKEYKKFLSNSTNVTNVMTVSSNIENKSTTLNQNV